MEKYDENVVYFISYAKLPANTPAANLHGVVGFGLFIDVEKGVIVDTSCTLLTEEAKIFLKEIIIGHDVHSEGITPLIEKVKLKYHGYAQKAICVILKDTYNRYLEWKKSI
ncbi:DUF3870 domain-containing protein [Wukongibacter baidiensis]|uniref:DUF3870 domain-containing protein n=1 Tax=Wukongibacter baidiensis TaxID=1723361 RepID=UPI003D7F26EB